VAEKKVSLSELRGHWGCYASGLVAPAPIAYPEPAPLAPNPYGAPMGQPVLQPAYGANYPTPIAQPVLPVPVAAPPIYTGITPPIYGAQPGYPPLSQPYGAQPSGMYSTGMYAPQYQSMGYPGRPF